MGAGSHPSARTLIRRYVTAAMATVLLLVGGLGGWAATTELSGAVVAPGRLVVETYPKKVQHVSGGIVAELRVREGDRVAAGDILIRLDDTQARASLAIVTKRLDELAARQARLAAERDDAEAISFPDALTARRDRPDVARILEAEQKLFDFRRSARAGQKAQLRERIAQLEEQIAGLEAQEAAKAEEVDLVKQELEGVEALFAKNLTEITRLVSLKREAARLKGERGELVASTAEARGRIAEIELQIIQIDQDLRSEVAAELREIQAQEAEFVERRVAAEDELKRIDIRAPQAGVVQQLTVHTVGGVIAAGEPVMLIVPQSDELRVEARISPRDIDQLHLGQAARLRFSAFNQRYTPELTGEITRIAADVTVDPQVGVGYYLVRASVPEAERARLGALVLLPGMPVEVFIETGERTVLSYFIKPLRDQIAKAFREE
jgi:HlyD family secretion protein